MLQETDVNCKEQLSKRGKRSRDKGKRGEREVAKIFQEAGFHARRSVQYNGRSGTAADVVDSQSPYRPSILSHLQKEYSDIIEWYLGDYKHNSDHAEHLLFPVLAAGENDHSYMQPVFCTLK